MGEAWVDDITLACRHCGRTHGLFVRVGSELACPAAPLLPVQRASIATVHAAELRIREQMQARGGADRYRVRAGKS